MRKINLRSPKIIWPLAFVLPFLMAFIYVWAYASIGWFHRLIFTSDNGIFTMFVVFCFLLLPSFFLFWFIGPSRERRSKEIAIFLALQVLFLPILWLFIAHLGCSLFHQCI